MVYVNGSDMQILSYNIIYAAESLPKLNIEQTNLI